MDQDGLPLPDEENWSFVYNKLFLLAEEKNNAELRSYAIEFLEGSNRPTDEIHDIIINAFTLYKNQDLRNATYALLKEECDDAEYSFYSVMDRLRKAEDGDDVEHILQLEEYIDRADSARARTYRAFMKVDTLPRF